MKACSPWTPALSEPHSPDTDISTSTSPGWSGGMGSVSTSTMSVLLTIARLRVSWLLIASPMAVGWNLLCRSQVAPSRWWDVHRGPFVKINGRSAAPVARHAEA